jgi:hypothetical protein
VSLIFMDPRQGPNRGQVSPAKRLPSLEKKRIGLLWNNRPHGDVMLRHVAETLNAKHGLAEIYFTKKMFIGNAAPEEILKDLASRVDAVIVGVGD